ncbi:MAG: hypothetical protein HQL75_13870 [Magnetococcales bacterium]|nr:hypothetical protein [Magnetococcales bacterium]
MMKNPAPWSKRPKRFGIKPLLFALLWLAGSFCFLVDGVVDAKEDVFANDGLHDPQGPSFGELQRPDEAFVGFPTDTVGNKVRWVKALRDGAINPRTNIVPETKIKILDMDLILGNTGDNAFVLFPHRAHTEWLDCANCHPEPFKEKYGTSGIKMGAILEGKFCGKCHGAVAFPLTECARCHSVKPDTFRGKFGVQPVAKH